MFEVSTLFCAILFVTAAMAATYYFADAKNKREQLASLSELLAVERLDKREWQNKALFKHGNTPLGFENREKKEVEQQPAPKIVLRGELEARAREASEQAETIVTVGSVNGRRRDVVSKAEEIINATK